MTTHRSSHPDGDVLQAFASRELPREATGPVEAHLAGCARCRSEVEAWTVLFGRLEELPGHVPSPDFGTRVMARVNRPEPESADVEADRAPARWLDRLVARLRGWLPGGSDGRTRPTPGRAVRPAPSDRTQPRSGGHPGPERLQEWLEGHLSPALVRRVEAHLDDCTGCRTQVEAWKPLLARLDALDHLPAPSGLGAAVMARVDVDAVAARARQATTSPWARLGSLLRRLRPGSSRGWLLAGGLGALPTATAAALVIAVTVHPLLSLGGIATLARWRLTEWVLGSGEAALGHLATLGGGAALSLAQVVSQAPSAIVAGTAVLLAGSVLSAWILLRVLPLPTLLQSRHEPRPS